MNTMTDPVSTLSNAAARPGLAKVLLFDAFTCAAMGVALLALTPFLAALLGLPAALLTWAGVLLLASAVLMLVAGRQRPPAAALVMLIVLGNVAWAVASGYVAFAVDGVTAVGRVFVIAQALAVLVLAWLEWRGGMK
ncbi:hypothetical protein [Hydrogenophaga sp.]|uniref:hypothetical protein n=1 Tax=Hydrogenophaga sp. TaxID=1904254 RepID=UPI003D1083B9